MESLGRTTLVVLLLVGIFFLGGKILKKSSLDELDASVNNAQGENENTVNVLKQFTDVPKGSVSVRSKAVSSKITEKPVKPQIHPNREKKITPHVTEPEIEAYSQKIDFKPVDEEDRQLTAEVLRNTPVANTTVSNDTTKAVVSTQPADNFAESKVKEPLDFDRISRINDIYAKVSEALEWD